MKLPAWGAVLLAWLSAGPAHGQEERFELRIPGEALGARGTMQVWAQGGGLASLQDELTQLYLQLSPSLVEVRTALVAGGARREVVAAGVVLSSDGYVVAPVFPSGEMTLTVRRADGQVFSGVLIASNADYGLSLIQVVELRGMQPRLFPGDFMMEGAPVIALGNAFGLEASMSLGILTGKGRIAGEARRLLQITNAVNPGDGGGLLADARGRVIGILLNSLPDLARAGVAVGMEDSAGDRISGLDEESASRATGVGFAVPIEVVLGLFPDQVGHLLRRNRLLGVEVERRLLVVDVQGSPKRYWTLEVTSVVPGSAAEAAGIQARDVIIEMAGNPISTLEDLGGAIFTAPERTTLSLLREGNAIQLSVDLSIRPLPLKPPVSKIEPPEED
jgi:S1-C subfamily serine protease